LIKISLVTNYCKTTLQLIDFRQLLFGLGSHLFVKVPQPGDNEETFLVFKSSYHVILPV